MLSQHKGKWIDFIPIIIGATGVVAHETVEGIKRLDIEGLDIVDLQKASALATVHMFRTLL